MSEAFFLSCNKFANFFFHRHTLSAVALLACCYSIMRSVVHWNSKTRQFSLSLSLSLTLNFLDQNWPPLLMTSTKHTLYYGFMVGCLICFPFALRTMVMYQNWVFDFLGKIVMNPVNFPLIIIRVCSLSVMRVSE